MTTPQRSSSGARRRSGGGGGGRPSSGKPTTASTNSNIQPLQPTAEPPDIKSFREWPLGEELWAAIEAMGITKPTPIQCLAIGEVLAGKDVIAKAETGTGKTLAFGAPMIAKVDPARASVLGLVLCPTRELAEQGQKVLAKIGAARGLKVALIVGGEPMEPQIKALQGGAQVVVGTPGRVLDLYKQRFLSFPWTEFVVLDEADVMLEIGFIDDVKQILSLTPDERQTLLFSATFPPELLKLAREYTRNPAEVATSSGVSTVDNITQGWISVEEDDRALTLIRLIEQSDEKDVLLVFCDRRTDVDKLMRRLERLPFSIKALHGGYDQAARFRVMSAFRTGEVKVLVATDVASRGLDVAHVTHVVNFTSPHDITDYTHRIGRTGRAGRKGAAITLVSAFDLRKWKPIQRDATWEIPELPAPGSTRARSTRGPERESAARPESGARGDGGARRASPARGDEGRAASARSDEGRAASSQRAPRRDDARARQWPEAHDAPHVGEAPRGPRPDDPLLHRDAPPPRERHAPRWPEDEGAPHTARETQPPRGRDERAPTRRADTRPIERAQAPREEERLTQAEASRGRDTHERRPRRDESAARPDARNEPRNEPRGEARGERTRRSGVDAPRAPQAPADDVPTRRQPARGDEARAAREPRRDEPSTARPRATEERAPARTTRERSGAAPSQREPVREERGRSSAARDGGRAAPASELDFQREGRSGRMSTSRAPSSEAPRAARDERAPIPRRDEGRDESRSAPREPRRRDQGSDSRERGAGLPRERSADLPRERSVDMPRERGATSTRERGADLPRERGVDAPRERGASATRAAPSERRPTSGRAAPSERAPSSSRAAPSERSRGDETRPARARSDEPRDEQPRRQRTRDEEASRAAPTRSDERASERAPREGGTRTRDTRSGEVAPRTTRSNDAPAAREERARAPAATARRNETEPRRGSASESGFGAGTDHESPPARREPRRRS